LFVLFVSISLTQTKQIWEGCVWIWYAIVVFHFFRSWLRLCSGVL